ncbi:hypothetical protein CEXT_719541 [Caerostris extrusa]|uniref:Uncharacterized protein n=1 Tax=Caerostris extrusa TaxID=172846 RepID=A0AAV4RN02_CAEEX|nr:hypothetical protein CEXT_719541 [Caerostris extrusa]
MKYGMAIAVGKSIDSGGHCLFFRDHLGLCRGDVTSANGTVSSSVLLTEDAQKREAQEARHPRMRNTTSLLSTAHAT